MKIIQTNLKSNLDQRGPTTGPRAAHKSCRLQAAATFFLKNAMILGRK